MLAVQEAGVNKPFQNSGEVKCQVCGAVVGADGYDHLRAMELDPPHAQALSCGSWQSLVRDPSGEAR